MTNPYVLIYGVSTNILTKELKGFTGKKSSHLKLY